MSELKNIVFSSTRQWNPGDEFILAGVRRILATVGLQYNSILYNRHPDIRSVHQDRQYFRYSQVPPDFHASPVTADLEANIKFGFWDNSIRPGIDGGFIDWVVFAGTPEWCSGRLFDLYDTIIRHNLPLMILGVGGDCDLYHEYFRTVISQAKVFTVRDPETLAAVRAQGFTGAELLACPALLAAPAEAERQLTQVRKVGLVYQATASDTVIWNGFSEAAYVYMKMLFGALRARFGATQQFELVCHYADEIPLAKRDFPDLPVHYAHDSADYIKIYRTFDLVIGPRVHGIGLAASLGIPGVALTHDRRGRTCEGFLAPLVEIGTAPLEVAEIVAGIIATVAEKNAALLAHKEATMTRYTALVGAALSEATASYDVPHEMTRLLHYNLADLAPLQAAVQAARSQGQSVYEPADPNPNLDQELRERLINIEGKFDALLRLRVKPEELLPPPEFNIGSITNSHRQSKFQLMRLFHCLADLASSQAAIQAARSQELRERLINIEGKIDALLRLRVKSEELLPPPN